MSTIFGALPSAGTMQCIARGAQPPRLQFGAPSHPTRDRRTSPNSACIPPAGCGTRGASHCTRGGRAPHPNCMVPASSRFNVRTDERVAIMRARRAWRRLNRAELRSPIPTGLHHPAQGCRLREATLGQRPEISCQPQRGCVTVGHPVWRNPVGVGFCLSDEPRVARASQPWADGRSPVGAETLRPTRASDWEEPTP